MVSSLRSSALSLAIAATLATTSRAYAGDDAPGALGLHYIVEPSCPTRARFEAEVTARTARARFVPLSSQTQRAFSIRVERAQQDHTVGHLEGIDADGARTSRSITGASCAEVVTALALVAALAIDPEATLDPIALTAGEGAPTDAEPVAVSASRDAATLAPSPSRAPAERAADRPRTRAGRPVHISFAGITAFGLSRAAAAGVDLRATVESRPLGPSIGVGGSILWSTPFDGSPEATFRYLTGDLEVSPIGLRVSSRVVVRPCLQVAAGVVTGRGVASPHPEEASRAWVDGRALLRVSLSHGPLDVELRGGALVPVTHPKFVFQAPYTVLHETPALAALVGVGAGAHF